MHTSGLMLWKVRQQKEHSYTGSTYSYSFWWHDPCKLMQDLVLSVELVSAIIRWSPSKVTLILVTRGCFGPFATLRFHASHLPLPHAKRMAAPGNWTSRLCAARGRSQDLQEWYVQATPSALLPVSQGKRWGRRKMNKAPNPKVSSGIGTQTTDHLAAWFWTRQPKSCSPRAT